ncbi:MAG: DUF899 family protein [Pseudonocardia sp.]|nr:DUF899 family protein [Pseudonocardia sp.]
MSTGNLPDVVPREDRLAARRKPLVEEKELTRERDRVNAERRRWAYDLDADGIGGLRQLHVRNRPAATSTTTSTRPWTTGSRLSRSGIGLRPKWPTTAPPSVARRRGRSRRDALRFPDEYDT